MGGFSSCVSRENRRGALPGMLLGNTPEAMEGERVGVQAHSCICSAFTEMPVHVFRAGKTLVMGCS